MPPTTAAWAWFLASTLKMGNVSAIVVAIAFGVQSVGLSYALAAVNFLGGGAIQNEDEGPAARPFIFLLDVFCSFALMLLLLSLPLAVIVAVIGLLT
jgi:hypothetical protein